MSLKRIGVILLVLWAATVLVSVESASAQCAMCRTALDQEGGQVAAGFNRGILFLLAMPYVVFGSIAGSVKFTSRSGSGATATTRSSDTTSAAPTPTAWSGRSARA